MTKVEHALTELLLARPPVTAVGYAGDRLAAGRLLNKKQMAKLLNISPRSVDTWMKRGWVPYLKIGNSVRFNEASVFRHLDNTTLVDRGGGYSVHVHRL